MPNGRCRLHGGKSTGPRTAKGIARRAAAHTKHRGQSAAQRAEDLYLRTLNQRTRLKAAARRLQAYLPKEMAARLADFPRELWAPIHPSNLPFVKNPEPTPEQDSPAGLRPDAGPARNAARPLPRGLAAERQAARAEAAALAPWHQAIAFARAARRAALAAKRTARQAARTASAAKRTARQATHAARVPPAPAARPSAPNPPEDQLSLLERELAARKAGLRVRVSEPDRPKAANAPKPDSTFSRIYPLNPDTAAAPAQKPESALSRIYPLNPDNAAPAPKPNSAFPRIIPLNPEATPPRQPTRLAPTMAEALRTTTLAETWTLDLAAELAQRLGHLLPAGGRRIPQSMPATDPVANAVRSFLAEQQRPAPPAAQQPAAGRPHLSVLVPGKPTV